MNEEEFWETFYSLLPEHDEEYFIAPIVEDGKLFLVESWFPFPQSDMEMMVLQQTEIDLG